MIKSSVTISLVNEARGGPFVFWDGLEAGCRSAAALGFDAVEVFAPSAAAVDAGLLQSLLDDLNLKLAAVGTGAGWVIHRWQLCSAHAEHRQQACDFIRSIIDMGGPFGAPAIIGSMQGRWGDDVSQPAAMDYLREALEVLGEHAGQYGIPLIYEPLNRYETNLICTMADGVELLNSLTTNNVKLLADLFHMHIEETDMAQAIHTAADNIGHLHFVDSNRQAAGRGHMQYGPIVEALRAVNYTGYASAEVLPLPDSETAARQTITAFRECFGS